MTAEDDELFVSPQVKVDMFIHDLEGTLVDGGKLLHDASTRHLVRKRLSELLESQMHLANLILYAEIHEQEAAEVRAA